MSSAQSAVFLLYNLLAFVDFLFFTDWETLTSSCKNLSGAVHLPSLDVKSRALKGLLIVVRKEGHSQLAWAHSSAFVAYPKLYIIIHGRLEAFPLGKEERMQVDTYKQYCHFADVTSGETSSRKTFPSNHKANEL